MVLMMGIINLIIMLALLIMGVYGFVLFVKVANRAIKALDIYINEKTNNMSKDDNKIDINIDKLNDIKNESNNNKK